MYFVLTKTATVVCRYVFSGSDVGKKLPERRNVPGKSLRRVNGGLESPSTHFSFDEFPLVKI